MERQRGSLIGLVVVAALTIGCGSARAGDIVEATPAMIRDDTAAVRAAFADGYLALVGPLNLRVRELGRRVDSVTGLAEMRAISLAYAVVEEEFATGLRALVPPDELKPTVHAAVSAAEQVAALNRRAAADDDVTSVGPSLGTALDAQRAALGELRAALGLGPVPAG